MDFLYTKPLLLQDVRDAHRAEFSSRFETLPFEVDVEGPFCASYVNRGEE